MSTVPSQNEIFGVTRRRVRVRSASAAGPGLDATDPATSKFEPSLAYDSTRNEVRFVWIGTYARTRSSRCGTERRSADLSTSGGEITVSEMGGSAGQREQRRRRCSSRRRSASTRSYGRAI